MELKLAYIDIASRSLCAARSLARDGLYEISTFESYHAFESMGGALVSAFGRNYPRGHTQVQYPRANI